jgi:hypothetical protein
MLLIQYKFRKFIIFYRLICIFFNYIIKYIKIFIYKYIDMPTDEEKKQKRAELLKKL